MSKFALLVLVPVVLMLSGCRSEFERIRTSGDPTQIYERATEYYNNGEYQRAQTLYELVISSFRGQPQAEEISFKYAYTYYYLKQYILAAYYFNNFAQTYGGSRLREEANYMAAYSNYQLSPTFRLDQSYTQKAIEAFQEFINQYPNSERVAESNKLIDEMRAKLEQKEVETARLYLDLQQYQAAIRALDNVLKDYPDTDQAEELRFLIIRAAYEWATNSFVERQTERYEEVVQRAGEFLERYRTSGYRGQVEDMLENSQARLKQLEDVRHQNASARAGS